MSLTKTAKVTRRAVAVFVIIISLLFVGRLGWNVGLSVYYHFFPPEKPPPETEFGKIALPQIPGTQSDTSKWNFTLDTPTGRLPHLPDRLPVFPLRNPAATPLTELKAEQLAASLGFTTKPQIPSPSIYEWKTNWRTLRMNVVSQAFVLESDPQILEIQLSRGQSLPESQAKARALSFLNELNLSNKNLKSARKEASYIKIEKGELKQAESLSQGHLTRIDLFKIIAVDGKNYNVYSPEPYQGLTYLAISGQRGEEFYERVPYARYQNWEILTDEGSTYPLLSPNDAWNALTSGKGTLVYLKPQDSGPYQNPAVPNVEEVKIQKVSLAYYESKAPQEYLTPIYIFKGIAEVEGQAPWEVIFYVHGITEEWKK